MKKRVLTLLFALFICLGSTVSVFANEDKTRLYDDADILLMAEEIYLSDKLDQVSEEYKVDIIIVTVETIGMYSSDTYIENVYDSNNFGYGDNKDGVLLLLAMQEREYRILSNGFAADAISSEDINYIGDEIVSYLSDGYYVDAFDLFIDECEYQINGEINGFPFPFTMAILISLAIGFIVSLIVTGVMRAQLKSVKKQNSAKEYTKAGSMKLTLSRDLYLYRTINRRPRETSSKSGSRSSGGSRNIGGGRF